MTSEQFSEKIKLRDGKRRQNHAIIVGLRPSVMIS